MRKRTAAQPRHLPDRTVPTRPYGRSDGVRAGLSNLYRFIRLILGPDIPDNAIGKRWQMDIKNFSDFKYGKYPVPRFERLVTLAKVLGVDDHLVYEVAKGTPAERVYRMITTPLGRKKLIQTIIGKYSVGKLARANNQLNA
jgi:hypothetical protein